MEANGQRQALGAIAKQVAGCHDCPLYRGATNPVPGEGNPSAQIMFIGEGPGFYEDRQGRPFVGAAGKFLDELLASTGMERKTVFITNVVKHRPPNNRDPQPDEIAACRKYLDAQIEVIAPRVIVTLGRHSMQRYFPGESIGRVHGQPRRKDGFMVVPMYHPAAALHQVSLRKVIETDFRKLPEFLAKTLHQDAGFGSDAVPAHLRATPANNSTDPAADAASTTGAPEPGQPEAQQMRLL